MKLTDEEKKLFGIRSTLPKLTDEEKKLFGVRSTLPDRVASAKLYSNATALSETYKRYKNYAEYLASPEWKARAAAVMRRDKKLCQACITATATEVHHLTYDHIFNEPLFDLVAVCRSCHSAISAMDRRRKGR